MIKNILYCLIIISCSLYLTACCSKDKTCPAGNATESDFPYKLGEQLVFADSSGIVIKVKLGNQLITTPEFSIEGSCGIPRKDMGCFSSTTFSSFTGEVFSFSISLPWLRFSDASS
jgi:hypothetical protein